MSLRSLPVMLAAALSVLSVSTPARAATRAGARCPSAFRQAPGRPLRFRLTAAPAVGLFNADRRPDLVIATPRALRILFGRRHGRFRVGPRLSSVGPPTTGVAVTDLNNDNLADTVTASRADTTAVEPATLQTNLGDGHGGFTFSVIDPLDLVQITGPVVADFNGDHLADVAFLGQDLLGRTSLNVMLGNGGGGLAPAPGSPMPTNGYSLTIGDFNTDGKPDLLMGEMFGGAVDVELGQGNGSFKSGPDASPPGGWETAHAVGDFNQDGRQDLTQASLKALRVRLGDGQGRFVRTAAKLRWKGMWQLAVADFNGDHHQDVAAAGGGDDVRVAWGDGTGALAKAPRTKLDVVGEISGLLSADFNHDGHSDLAVVSARVRSNVSRITVFLARRRIHCR